MKAAITVAWVAGAILAYHLLWACADWVTNSVFPPEGWVWVAYRAHWVAFANLSLGAMLAALAITGLDSKAPSG